ncbi:MAG: hypothetical protein KDC27_05915, partial [Acidobacteria bacterium]|nr:hypothetical protein [Acidobacteriota bacterium]
NRSDGEVVEDNRIVGGVEFTSFDETISVSGQAFEARFPLNDYYGDGNRPTDVWVRIRRDPSLPGPWRREGMEYVGIVNWPGSSTVAVDLSSLEVEGELESGAQVRIWPVQQPGASWNVTYAGAPVSFPMTGWTADWPVGRPPGKALPATFPELGVFCVVWETAGAPWNREPVREPDPGAGLEAQAAWPLRRDAWRQTDPQMRSELLAERRAAWRAQRLGRTV